MVNTSTAMARDCWRMMAAPAMHIVVVFSSIATNMPQKANNRVLVTNPTCRMPSKRGAW